jgi:Uma2 family endonuclease
MRSRHVAKPLKECRCIERDAPTTAFCSMLEDAAMSFVIHATVSVGADPVATTLVLEDVVEIPLNLDSLEGFRRWTQSPGFPASGRIDFIGPRIEVDMSPEDLFSHGTLKTEMVTVLNGRIKRAGLGYVFTDSTRVSSPAADLSSEPDIVFVSEETIDKGSVILVSKRKADRERFVELEGAPDLVVEIVSDSSVKKDTLRLPQAYYEAGIPEFWLVDARGAELVFRIHRRGDSGYDRVASDREGFQYSSILDCWFRLDRQRNKRGRWTFDLLEKEPNTRRERQQ